MRKNNEGYTLPLVLIVMLVLGIVAVSVMSVSLHNLQAQQASIQRMESKYAAQGEIEKVIAEIQKEINKVDVSDSSIKAQGARDKVTYAIQTAVKIVLGIENAAVIWDTALEDNSTCAVVLTVEQETTKIVCKIEYQDVVTIVDSAVKVNPKEPTYLSYEFLAISPEGGGA